MLCLFTAPHWCIINIIRIIVLLASISCPHCQCVWRAVTRDSRYSWHWSAATVTYISAAHIHHQCLQQAPTHSRQWHHGDALQPPLTLDTRQWKSFVGYWVSLPCTWKHFKRKKRKSLKRPWKLPTEFYRSTNIVHTMHQATNPGDEEDHGNTCFTVSFDGTWQKRGHASMQGMAALINVVTGLVVDYEVLFCCSCKKAQLGADSHAFTAWYGEHQDDYFINYHGSLNTMEVEAAKCLLGQSVQKTDWYTQGCLVMLTPKAFQLSSSWSHMAWMLRLSDKSVWTMHTSVWAQHFSKCR